MTFFILIFTLVTAGHTMEFSRFTKSAENNLLQKFITSSDQVTFEKRTNFYDDNKDWRVGVMRPEKNKNTIGELSEVLQKIRDTDSYLRKKQLSFNQLTGDPLHQAHWILDEYRIKDNSVLHSDLEKIFKALQKEKWELEEGVELSADGKSMRKITAGKPGPYSPVSGKDCKIQDSIKVCRFYPHGVLYVR